MIKTFLRLYWLPLLIIAGLALMVYRLYNATPKAVAAAHQVTEKVNAPVQHRLDEQGKTHAFKPLPEGSQADKSAHYQTTIDSLVKALKISRKAHRDFIALSTHNSGAVLPVINWIDTGIYYRDQWLNFSYRPGDSLRYSIYDSLVISTYYKRAKWWKKKEIYLDAWSINPRAKVAGLTGFFVKNEAFQRFQFGLFGGWNRRAGIDNIEGGVFSELQLSRRLALAGEAAYNMNAAGLRQSYSVKLKYKLINF